MTPAFIVSFMVYGVITPYLSILVHGLGYSLLWVGILLGIFEGAGIAGPFVFGYWADRAGSYRGPLLAANLLPALAVIPLALFPRPAVSALCLALLAFGFRATTSLLDAVTTIRLGKGGDYGRVRVTGSISFIGFALFLQWTPFLKPDGAGNIALWIALTSAASAAPVLLLSRRMLDGAGSRNAPVRGPPPSRPFRLSLYFVTGFTLIFLCRFSMAAVYTYFPLYLTRVMNWDAVGLMFALAAAAEVPVMFVSARFLRRGGALPLLCLAACGISVRLFIWALFPFRAPVIAAQLLHSLCFGIYHPAAVHFIATVFPPEKRGVGMSIYLALGSGLPTLLGNMLGGVVVEAAGYRVLFALFASVTAAAALAYGIQRMAELKRQARKRRDIEIINTHAARFNREAEENLVFQDMP
jgi:PPP family 3-phenylpropionic acid transporter